MSDYRDRLGHHLDEAERTELATLRTFRDQYADDAAATKGGRERLEHAERDRDEAQAEVEQVGTAYRVVNGLYQSAEQDRQRAEAAVAAGLALAIHSNDDCTFPDDVCICAVPIFEIRKALAGVTGPKEAP